MKYATVIYYSISQTEFFQTHSFDEQWHNFYIEKMLVYILYLCLQLH